MDWIAAVTKDGDEGGEQEQLRHGDAAAAGLGSCHHAEKNLHLKHCPNSQPQLSFLTKGNLKIALVDDSLNNSSSEQGRSRIDAQQS